MTNRAAHLFERAIDRADHVAIVFGDERISFAKLAERVRDSAAQLSRIGIAKGDRVAVMLPNCPDFIIVQQALFAVGAIFSPINVLYQPGEVARTLASCDISTLILSRVLIERAPTAHDVATPPLRVIMIENGKLATAGEAQLAAPATPQASSPLAEVAADDVVMLLHTSATTGTSKGVMLTAANLAANYDRTPDWLGLTADDVILCALPLYNTFGLNQCINAMLVSGATLVLHPRFDAAHCLESIQRDRCTFLPAVPTMLQKLFDDPLATSSRLQSLALIMTGGAPVPAALLSRVERGGGGTIRLLTGYGLTEATALVTLTRVELNETGEIRRGRTIGQVLDGMKLVILSTDGTRLGSGEIGEICIGGPNVMLGYYQAPDDTATALAGGWLHSGDLGYLDDDGFAFIVDRIKDVIIRGGQNIYPADIEEVLYHIDGVSEAAVIARPHDLLGEVPVAYVAFGIGRQPTIGEMEDRLRTELAPFKMPAEIRVLPSLPKGPTGKILRRQLRAEQEPAA